MSEKYGFSVVAPISVTVPSSTAGQQHVLLRLRPAVDLVDEQHRSEQPALGALHHLAGVGDPGGHRRELDQLGADGVGEQVRERGLAGPGRPPQDRSRAGSRPRRAS